MDDGLLDASILLRESNTVRLQSLNPLIPLGFIETSLVLQDTEFDHLLLEQLAPDLFRPIKPSGNIPLHPILFELRPVLTKHLGRKETEDAEVVGFTHFLWSPSEHKLSVDPRQSLGGA